GRPPRPQPSSTSDDGCVTSSVFASRRYTLRPIGAPGGRWEAAAVTSRMPPPRRYPTTSRRKARQRIAPEYESGGRPRLLPYALQLIGRLTIGVLEACL